MSKREGHRGRRVAATVGAGAVAAGMAAALLPRPARHCYRQSPFWRLYDRGAQATDRAIGWDRLPTPLGLMVLVGLRNLLRKHNLHDTTGLPAVDTPAVPPFDPSLRTARTADGTHNDLEHPAMGMAGSRFGRNVPCSTPSPSPCRTCSSPAHARSAASCSPGPRAEFRPPRGPTPWWLPGCNS